METFSFFILFIFGEVILKHFRWAKNKFSADLSKNYSDALGLGFIFAPIQNQPFCVTEDVLNEGKVSSISLQRNYSPNDHAFLCCYDMIFVSWNKFIRCSIRVFNTRQANMPAFRLKWKSLMECLSFPLILNSPDQKFKFSEGFVLLVTHCYNFLSR